MRDADQRRTTDPRDRGFPDRSAGVPAATSARPRRPAPVTILAVLELVSATGYLLTLLFLLGVTQSRLAGLDLGSLALVENELLSSALTGGLAFVMMLVALAAAVLLLRMNRLGWTVTMLVTGLSLSSQIYFYVTRSELVPVMMLTSVVTVLYLNQREVRTAFGIGRAAELSSPELEERA